MSDANSNVGEFTKVLPPELIEPSRVCRIAHDICAIDVVRYELYIHAANIYLTLYYTYILMCIILKVSK